MPYFALGSVTSSQSKNKEGRQAKKQRRLPGWMARLACLPWSYPKCLSCEKGGLSRVEVSGCVKESGRARGARVTRKTTTPAYRRTLGSEECAVAGPRCRPNFPCLCPCRKQANVRRIRGVQCSAHEKRPEGGLDGRVAPRALALASPRSPFVAFRAKNLPLLSYEWASGDTQIGRALPVAFLMCCILDVE